MFTNGILFVLGCAAGLLVLFIVLPLCLWLLGLLLFHSPDKDTGAQPIIKSEPAPPLADETRQFLAEHAERVRVRLEKLNPPNSLQRRGWEEDWIAETIEQRRERLENGLAGSLDK